MNNDKDEMRLDRSGETGNENNFPEDNVGKPTDSPNTAEASVFRDTADMKTTSDLKSSPDFSNQENKDNTKGSQRIPMDLL